jgi:nucleoside-diphosphate-sugar epimerase
LSNKNILITGATGAIGREMLRQLDTNHSLKGITVFARDSRHNRKYLKPYSRKIQIIHGDIRNKNEVLKACKGQDMVIHLAAILPTYPGQIDQLAETTNFEGTDNVVSSLEEVAPKAFLLFSSSIAVYGDRLRNPNIRISDSLPDHKHDAYARSKMKAEARIQKSRMKWSIFRLAVIMGIGNHKLSEKMFEMPLQTSLEIATIRDTARAFIHATEQLSQLEGKIFNLGGGPNCRITYQEFLSRAFQCYGLGMVDFPAFAFARQNFHCGHYIDGDVLEEILHFQQDDIHAYFERFRSSVPHIQRAFTTPFAGIVKKYLSRLSKPYKAYKTKDAERIRYFFGHTK